MVQRVDYYTLLSRAVESLERDAYAARGAIYDREHKALLKRLISSSAPCSDADIAREEKAFRDAIRRIEFSDEGIQAPRTPQREPAAAWPNSAKEKARALRREMPQAPANDERVIPRDARPYLDSGFEEAGRRPLGREAPQDEPGWNDQEQMGQEPKGQERKSRSLLKPAVVYVLVLASVLGAAGLGYGYVVGGIGLGWLNNLWPGQAAPASQRAMLYQGGQAGRSGKPTEGKAVWRTRTETGSDGNPNTVVTLDVDIPEQHIALSLSLSRVGDTGSGMSHLLELRFARPQDLPFGGISRISNIAMKGTETESGESLVGTTIEIAPGQFMFGFLGVADVVQQNVQRLRTQKWLDLTLIFANNAAYTLTVEKGASGERVLNEAFAKWGQ